MTRHRTLDGIGVGPGLLLLGAGAVAATMLYSEVRKRREQQLAAQTAALQRQELIKGFYNTGRKVAATPHNRVSSANALRDFIKKTLPQSTPYSGGQQLVQGALSNAGVFAAGGPVAGVVALSVFAASFVAAKSTEPARESARLRAEFSQRLQNASEEELAYMRGIAVERLSQWCAGYTPDAVIALPLNPMQQTGLTLQRVQDSPVLRAFFDAPRSIAGGQFHKGMILPSEKNVVFADAGWKGGYLFPSPRVCNLMIEMGVFTMPDSCAALPRPVVLPKPPARERTTTVRSDIRAQKTLTTFK